MSTVHLSSIDVIKGHSLYRIFSLNLIMNWGMVLQSCLAFEVVHRYQYSCCRFRTGKGLGYSAHFVGNKLVLETVGRGHKKPQTHPVDFVFQSYQVSYILRD